MSVIPRMFDGDFLSHLRIERKFGGVLRGDELFRVVINLVHCDIN